MRGPLSSKGSTGDKILRGLALSAALLAIVTLVALGFKVIKGSKLAFDTFGFGFITDSTWNPTGGEDGNGLYGAWVMIYGTLVTSLSALAVALPIGVAIGLYLAELARDSVARVVGPLVEMLAAVPSVVVGFWGLIVLAPIVSKYIEPFLYDHFGFIPLFGEPQTTGLSLFTASLILSIMILPIIASISRDLFLTVPHEMKDGAEALGATHWEVVRGVDLPGLRRGHRLGRAARAWARSRRGDRGGPGDRRRPEGRLLAVSSRRHAWRAGSRRSSPQRSRTSRSRRSTTWA